MPRKELTTAVSEPGKDGAIQVEVTLPVRQGRREAGRNGELGSVSKPVSRPQPRITRLMALAIKFQDMIDHSEVRDYADLARLGYVSRARLTQIMNLLLLAPDIQEEILLTHATSTGIEERHLRSVTSEVSWQEQRRLWHRIRPTG